MLKERKCGREGYKVSNELRPLFAKRGLPSQLQSRKWQLMIDTVVVRARAVNVKQTSRLIPACALDLGSNP